jgi:hypothetical protein
MWTCEACGAITPEYAQSDHCYDCGARRGTYRTNADNVYNQQISMLSTYAFGQFFDYLDIPRDELVYLSPRALPRPDEPEFDTYDDLPWPVLQPWRRQVYRLMPAYRCFTDRFPALQQFFLKRPRRILRQTTLTLRLPYLRGKADTPARRAARAMALMEIQWGVPWLVWLLMLGCAALMLTRVLPPEAGVPLLVTGVLAVVVLNIVVATTGTPWMLAQTRADMHRQVLRYLAWAKARRAEETQRRGQ